MKRRRRKRRRRRKSRTSARQATAHRVSRVTMIWIFSSSKRLSEIRECALEKKKGSQKWVKSAVVTLGKSRSK